MINKDLEVVAQKVENLEGRITRLSHSNSELKDDLAELKQHYSNLVEGVNSRFQLFEKSFRKSGRA